LSTTPSLAKKIAPLIKNNNNNMLHNIIPKETDNATMDERVPHSMDQQHEERQNSM
jgi:hypothetical protein